MTARGPSFQHVLVANRGEIAVRVLRAAKSAGYRTTAVFSEADAGAPHVALADRSVCIGPAPVRESYLDIARVIAAARTTGADAVHPGYGMLAENPAFARACQEAGLVFIGPSPQAMALMGDKGAARRAAQAAGVPCIPGYDGDDQSAATLAEEARRIGFPLMVKAAAGGGGRGMRRVDGEPQLALALRDAASEALAAFGDGRLILELAVDGARHVEVQVIADQHGRTLHLGERDCSVQRRFQKVLEEAPSPAVDSDLRARMGAAAVSLASACGYVGAGTVEFLRAPDGRFFFLEMNTRLQVEHPVTELVTGLDLVLLQLSVAAGDPLPFGQDDVAWQGHAIEARLCTEDPSQGFLPQTGTVVRFVAPSDALARVDHGLCDGQAISPHYDSMVAKVIAHGRTRAEALRKLDRALSELCLFGVPHNGAFLRRVIGHPIFAAGEAHTGFLAEAGEGLAAAPNPDGLTWALAAALFCERDRRKGSPGPFAITGTVTHLLALRWGTTRKTLAVSYVRRPAHLVVMWDQECVRFEAVAMAHDRFTVTFGGAQLACRFAFSGDGLHLQTDAGTFDVYDETHAAAASRDEVGSGHVLSSMEAAVVSVGVAVGDPVSRGQSLLVLEAMKLQHHVLADVDGTVARVHVNAGDQVSIRTPLVEIAATTEEAHA